MHSDRWEIVPISQDIELSAEGLRHAFTVEDRDRERERESGQVSCVVRVVYG